MTVMLTVSWLLVFGIAASSVNCIGAVMPDGAVYVIVEPLLEEREPHALPLHELPEKDHAT